MRLVAVALMLWAAGLSLNVRLAAGPLADTRAGHWAVPAPFGLTLVATWELIVRGPEVPGDILAPPSAIGDAFSAQWPVIWADFVQTFIKGARSGYARGALAALAPAIPADRDGFLKRGLLPVDNFMAALPIAAAALAGSAFCGVIAAIEKRVTFWRPSHRG